jgi:16S rRNA (guanine(966)-N(2))-methyltransferase RsmD
MSLRIIGGIFKNRPLKSPRGEQTRPTAAVLRKSFFDICQPFIGGCRFLDLYAGSGAMGLEALSRGAEHATFIDRDRQALLCIRENIALLRVTAQTAVLAAELPKALLKLTAPFDVIFIDPPYGCEALPTLLSLIDSRRLLASGGHLFVEEGSPSALHPETLAFTHFFHAGSRSFSQSLLHHFLARPF